VKALLRTFGCRANQYDTEAARAMILDAGGSVVDSADEADVVIFNSCAVTSEAEADLRQAVRRVAGPRVSLRVVVMGCAAARDDGRIAALPGVTDVVAGADLPALAVALRLDASRTGLRPLMQTGSRALLRIQDGCDEHCTFCATTLARGAHRSRPLEDLVQEALALAEHHPEIVLTGVHIGSWGTETGTSLGALVQRLVYDVPRVRFRLSSVEATEVDSLLCDALSGDAGRLAPHLHAPLQSGSDVVLKRMGRHWYTAATYAREVERIVSLRSVFALGADIIAGFPGETDRDHELTLALIRELPFTYLHVFPYSARPGTAAGRFAGVVPPPVIKRRAAELRALGTEKMVAYRGTRTGGTADVVVIGDGPKRAGLTEDYLSVELSDGTLARRARFRARLSGPGGKGLVATAVGSP
jgi:threonylcarbamoyladenosine tRNA methylthiotransferase MtaB